MAAPRPEASHRDSESNGVAPETASSVTISLGITGHRARNSVFAANHARIEAVLQQIFSFVAEATVAGTTCSTVRTRLHSMLADGSDQMAARLALGRGWGLVSPLPFGRALNAAINAHPENAPDARAILAGREPVDVPTRERARAIHELADKARVFELSDRDAEIASMYLAQLEAPSDLAAMQQFAMEASQRVALASRIVIEQSDIVIAIWDGTEVTHSGGTRHSITLALELGAPVVWIDANEPHNWRILQKPESLATAHSINAPPEQRIATLRGLIWAIIRPEEKMTGEDSVTRALARERWHGRSNGFWHGYRRVEALFGAETLAQRLRNLRQVYETPDGIVHGSASVLIDHLRRMPGQDEAFVSLIQRKVLRRFAWFDGVSSYLSDNYRGGMVINFLLAPLAILAGIVYLPFFTAQSKWIFAIAEFTLLAFILALTALGRTGRWHERWFETRRVAEYFRHAPILLALGVARAPGRWPRGVDATWPEWFAQQALREVGLPHLAMTAGYLRIALDDLLDGHVVRQRNYHVGKAKRLAAAHKNLDRFSSVLFMLAVLSVSAYLVLWAAGVFEIWPEALSDRISHIFTLLGVIFPTLGGAVAGMRYFGDFERFAAISEVTAEKLASVHARIAVLLVSPDSEIRYDRVSELAHATDDIVVAEIENWQAVFGGKHVTVPI